MATITSAQQYDEVNEIVVRGILSYSVFILAGSARERPSFFLAKIEGGRRKTREKTKAEE